jgi:hypothetical protein
MADAEVLVAALEDGRPVDERGQSAPDALELIETGANRVEVVATFQFAP